MSNPGPPPSYREQLLAELDGIQVDFLALLDKSTIVQRRQPSGEGVVIVGLAKNKWADSDHALERAQMLLVERLRSWDLRVRLLFPVATPAFESRYVKRLRLLTGWAERRRGNDHSVPGSIAAAKAKCVETVQALREDLTGLIPDDPVAIRVVPDTNSLIDNPDLVAYRAALGPKYWVHLVPTTLGELDDLKRSGRNPDLRAAAQRASKRLKGLRDNGDIRAGTKVAGEVYATFEHKRPRADGLPEWLDLTVPDDRFVASTLSVQSDHPGSRVYVVTGDLNMQTKLAALGLPWFETPNP